MQVLRYSILFEIRIVHEFYLVQQDGSSFYALSPGDQEQVLADSVLRGTYDLRKDLHIRPNEESSQNMRDLGLRLVRTPTGFFVGAEGIRVFDAGQWKFRLKKPWNIESLSFFLDIRNTQWINFSSVPIGFGLPSRYYFTNGDAGNVKTFPSLSLPVTNFQSGRYYDMGSLAVISGTLQEAPEVTNTDQNWIPVSGNGFTNEEDRTLLPHRFTYWFEDAPVSTAVFELRDSAGSTVRTITVSDPSGKSQVGLDFTIDDSNNPIGTGRYSLVVTTNAYQYTKDILLNSQWYDHGRFGVVEIVRDTGHAPFQWLTSDGFLVPDHPVYEIRVRNRNVYQVFRSGKGKSLSPDPSIVNELQVQGNDLITTDKRRLSANPYTFLPNTFLPIPEERRLLKEDGKYKCVTYVEQLDGRIEYAP